MRKFLVTGAAGFIGMHVAQALLARGDEVVGIDNLNDYYSPQLKQDRLTHLQQQAGAEHWRFELMDVADNAALQALFARERFDGVVHLAAQAGVRYSLTNPHAYAQSNLVGFVNILEACRHHATAHLVYASSSSVYGGNVKMPFAETDPVDHPVSLYAATKKANELMAHTYSHLYGLPTTGLRFFTVYGPWGRPDMALFKFVRAVLAGQPIDVYNNGQMRRDFTYVDDVVNAVLKVMAVPPVATADAPAHRVLNVGNNGPVSLLDFIGCIEKATGIEAIKHFMPMQQGDVPETWADTTALEKGFGIRPNTDLQLGVQRFVDWYRGYYGDTGTV